MARVQIRIVAMVLALSFLGASILVAYRYLKQEWIPEQQVIREIEEHYEEPPAPPDPGIQPYEDALELVRSGKVEEAKGLMLQLMDVFEDSNRVALCEEAVGEMNLDALFSRRPMEGKLEYVVKRGDALSAIARKNRTTIAYMRQVNTMRSLTIHPGDRLVLFPLEFELELNVTAKTLRLRHKGKFFKRYDAVEAGLPEALSLPTKMRVASRTAWIDGGRVTETDPGLLEAEKWVQCSRRGSPLTVVLASVDVPEGLRAQLPSGFFFPDSDMEEIYSVLREGLVVSVVE